MVESEYVERVLIAIFKLCLRKITIKILLVLIRHIDNDLQIQLCQALTGMLIFFFYSVAIEVQIMCSKLHIHKKLESNFNPSSPLLSG
jgi:hypothetical protein